MDFDEYDYLEKALEPSERLKDSRSAEYKEDANIHKQNDRSRESGISEEAGERKRGRRKHHYRSQKTRAFYDDTERSERDGDKSERCLQKDNERFSHDEIHDRDQRNFDNRERKRKSFSGRSLDISGDRAQLREDWHFDKQVGKKDRAMNRERELGGSRYPRKSEEKKEEAVSKEPKDTFERDQLTVFAYQISLKADERDVYDFFSKAGKVRDVRLIMDSNLRRSKGMGFSLWLLFRHSRETSSWDDIAKNVLDSYVEFHDALSVPTAVSMTGQLLRGQPVLIKPSEAEKNAVSGATGPGTAMGPHNGGARRLYVGNLQYNITEIQLRQVFESFGPVEFVQLSRDSETGQSKGYAFIQFARLEDAQCAQTSLNGSLKLAGRVIKVSVVTEKTSAQEFGSVTGELDGNDGGNLEQHRARVPSVQRLECSYECAARSAWTLVCRENDYGHISNSSRVQDKVS